MKLFFNTETTGLADFKLPVTHPCQPHMVSCAAVLTDDDGNEVQSFRFIAKPDGTPSQPRALETHGITTEMQERFGVPRYVILQAYHALAVVADMRIAFNHDYDELVLAGEFFRAQSRDNLVVSELDLAKRFCEMKAMTSVCRIPSPYRVGQFKWPNLQEADTHAFGKPFEKAHDAMADVRATIAVHFWRVKQS